MKFAIFFLYLHSPFETAYADEYVNGYTRDNGTVVDSYERKDKNNYDNPTTIRDFSMPIQEKTRNENDALTRGNKYFSR